MHRVQVWRQAENVAGLHRNAFAKDADDLLLSDLGENLGFGARRLGDGHLGRNVPAEVKMFGANPVDGLAVLRAAGSRAQRQRHAVVGDEAGPAVEPGPPL